MPSTTVRKSYPSDLTDAQWAILEPLIPAAKHGGWPREVEMREILNAMFYTLPGQELRFLKGLEVERK